MCRGAKIIFWQVVGVSKKGSRRKKHFLSWKSKRNMKKMEGTFEKQKNIKLCFVDGWKHYSLNGLVFNCKVLFVFGRRKRAFSLTLSVFGKCHFFLSPYKSPNTTKIRVSGGHKGKRQNGTFGLKRGVFGRGLEKGFHCL